MSVNLLLKNQVVTLLEPLNNSAQLECGHIAPGAMGLEDCKTDEDFNRAAHPIYCPINCSLAPKKIVRADKPSEKESIRYCFERALKIKTLKQEKRVIRKIQEIIGLFDGKPLQPAVASAFNQIKQMGVHREQNGEKSLQPMKLSRLNLKDGSEELYLLPTDPNSSIYKFVINKHKNGMCFEIHVEPNGELFKTLEESNLLITEGGVCFSNKIENLKLVCALIHSLGLITEDHMEVIDELFADKPEVDLESLSLPPLVTLNSSYGTFANQPFRPISPDAEKDDHYDDSFWTTKPVKSSSGKAVPMEEDPELAEAIRLSILEESKKA